MPNQEKLLTSIISEKFNGINTLVKLSTVSTPPTTTKYIYILIINFIILLNN